LGYDFYDYSSFGDTDVVCIINPQHMFKSDTGHSGKIGVTQMFIAALREKDEDNKFVDMVDDDLIHFDELYHDETVTELEEAIGNKSFEILEVTDVNNVTEISPITILDLTTIKNNISKRIINF
jgi:hypothetical protein